METVALKDITKAILFYAHRLEKEAAETDGL
jgi:hypothetical protein